MHIRISPNTFPLQGDFQVCSYFDEADPYQCDGGPTASPTSSPKPTISPWPTASPTESSAPTVSICEGDNVIGSYDFESATFDPNSEPGFSVDTTGGIEPWQTDASTGVSTGACNGTTSGLTAGRSASGTTTLTIDIPYGATAVFFYYSHQDLGNNDEFSLTIGSETIEYGDPDDVTCTEQCLSIDPGATTIEFVCQINTGGSSNEFCSIVY